MCHLFPGMLTFIEHPGFTKTIGEVLSDSEYAEFQRHLAANPDAGDVTQGSAVCGKSAGPPRDEANAVALASSTWRSFTPVRCIFFTLTPKATSPT